LFIWQVIIFWGAPKITIKNKNEVIFMVFYHHILQKNIESPNFNIWFPLLIKIIKGYFFLYLHVSFIAKLFDYILLWNGHHVG
jgi:hypothetical protein